MTEQALLSRQQSNPEQAALFPSVTDKPELTTDDVIFPSEDKAPNLIETKETSYEDLVKNGLSSAVKSFEVGLGFKVKSELVAQFFDKEFIDKESLTTGEIDLERVSTLIQTEMEREVANNFENAQFLENQKIPQANIRLDTVRASEGPEVIKKFEKDIERLYARVEISTSIAEKLETELTELHNSDGEFELAEAYVNRLKDQAREEAIAILIGQNNDLLKRQEAIQERINILKGEQIEAQPEPAFIEPQQEMVAQETLIHQLTEKAKSLAHSLTNKRKIAQ